MLPDALKSLVERFREQGASYRGADYNEAQVRGDFIDRVIGLLGWDVANEEGAAEFFREVVKEDRLTMDGRSKSPDYSVQFGGKKLFFIEAKRPSKDLKFDAESAFQLRSYGWSANLPACLLTNFCEFAVYDTTIRPSVGDRSSKARVFYCKYDELGQTYRNGQTNWDYIYSIFSKEYVRKGSLDKFVKNDKKRGTQPVDEEFLKEIEQWREKLAQNIARNNTLDIDTLNEIVQKTIDRIVFLRICEDKGIEKYGTLKNIANKRKNTYSELLELYDSADEKYDSSLFYFNTEKGIQKVPDKISHKIKISDKPLLEIIDSMYYPAPYRFSEMPADILGSVYERFLGKKIILTSKNRCEVVYKPEVAKAGGVYYTPQYIVEYIVQNAVGEQLKGKTLPSVKGFSVVDPACGSGSFLIVAYQRLLDWYLEQYLKHPEKHGKRLVKMAENVYRLSAQERKRILTDHVYGVDIDRQAVEVTKLSLMLKALDGVQGQEIEQGRLIHERALPNLSNNIRCGNSLVGLDYYDNHLEPGEADAVKPFSWQKAFPAVFERGGFDCVVCNPPYLKEYTSRKVFEQTRKSHLAKYYQGKMDLWQFFACYGIDISNKSGTLGFIVPNNWVTNAGARLLRNKILDECTLKSMVDFGSFMVFDRASIQTMILVFKNFKRNNYPFDYRKLEDTKPTIQHAYQLIRKEDGEGLKYLKPMINRTELIDEYLVFSDDKTKILLNKIQSKQNFILDAKNEVAQGIVAPQDNLNGAGERALNYQIPKGTGIFVVSNKEYRDIGLNKKERRIVKPYYTTEQLGRFYGCDDNGYFIIYTSSEFKNPEKIKDYPNIKKHLDRFQKIITSENKPYGLNRARDEKFFTGEKIMSLRKCIQPTFTFTDFDCYVSQTFFIIKTDRINQKYLTAVLNSKLIAFWLRHKGKMQGGLYQLDKEPLLEIPIFDTASETIKKRIIDLVDQLLQLNKELQTTLLTGRAEQTQSRIAHCEDRLNALVYELYDLTQEEIAMVEKA